MLHQIIVLFLHSLVKLFLFLPMFFNVLILYLIPDLLYHVHVIVPHLEVLFTLVAFLLALHLL